MKVDGDPKPILERDIQRALRELQAQREMEQFDAIKRREQMRQQKEMATPEPRDLPPASWAWRNPA